MGRIRFKCPELHDWDVEDEDCPWALPMHDMGGFRAGRFTSPVIDDIVWISFEKSHPYGPLWTGASDPTRRKMYTLPQVSNPSPTPVNETGEPDVRPTDYNRQYLPKDGRPMFNGWVDRYGSMDISSSVGYFPSSHDKDPTPPDHDAVVEADFQQQSNRPEVNSPDNKYMARISKYGGMFVIGDQGYQWKKQGDAGEFHGNPELDDEFETQRWLYIQRMLNENKTSSDSRRISIMNRYGSRIEMRDTGWAQRGPIPSSSREGEYGPQSVLSNESQKDQRWLKLRTKGGFLIQAYDKGFHPQNDKYVKRNLLQEVGDLTENEEKHWGGNRDARWLRFVTRHGFKIVLDDRGSSETEADDRELPRGNGILMKGRRSPASRANEKVGDPRGFLFEFNENDKANHSTWSSPLGQSAEINDRYQYMMLASSLGTGWVRKYRGLKENEFIRKPMMIRDPEKTSHHLKIDNENEYIRFKTRANAGPGPENPPPPLILANPSGVGDGELQQGFEARDGSNGDGPWVELVDCQSRGLWLSKKYKLGVWRAKSKKGMYNWMDDENNNIVVFNSEANGTINIYANAKVNIISDNTVGIQANEIHFKAQDSIKMQAGNSKVTLSDGRLETDADYFGANLNAFVCGVFPGNGAGCPQPGGQEVDDVPIPIPPEVLEPKDRGKTYNGPFEECPVEEVEHTITQEQPPPPALPEPI